MKKERKNMKGSIVKDEYGSSSFPMKINIAEQIFIFKN